MGSDTCLKRPLKGLNPARIVGISCHLKRTLRLKWRGYPLPYGRFMMQQPPPQSLKALKGVVARIIMLQFISQPTATMRLTFLFMVALQVSGCGSPADRAQSYYERGVKLLAQHDNQRAALEFKNAIKLKKDLLPAWRDLGQIQELNHDWAGVIPTLRAIVELDPKDVATKLKLRTTHVRSSTASTREITNTPTFSP
jgi:tetratricopeptide (TPR) repeat protein